MWPVTVTAPALSSGIAQPALLAVSRILAPFGWGICTYVTVVLVAFLAAIAVEEWRTRHGAATANRSPSCSLDRGRSSLGERFRVAGLVPCRRPRLFERGTRRWASSTARR